MSAASDVLLWAVTGSAVGASLTPTTKHLAKRTLNPRVLLPVASTLTATLFALLAWRTTELIDLLVCSAFAALAVPLAIVDVRERRLPLPLLHASYTALITLTLTNSIANADIAEPLRATAGMAIAFALFLAIAVASRGGLGAGDVRLAGVIGWLLAGQNWTALANAATVFALTTLVALGAARTRRQTHVPAGPIMLTSAFAALLT